MHGQERRRGRDGGGHDRVSALAMNEVHATHRAGGCWGDAQPCQEADVAEGVAAGQGGEAFVAVLWGVRGGEGEVADGAEFGVGGG